MRGLRRRAACNFGILDMIREEHAPLSGLSRRDNGRVLRGEESSRELRSAPMQIAWAENQNHISSAATAPSDPSAVLKALKFSRWSENPIETTSQTAPAGSAPGMIQRQRACARDGAMR